MQSQRTNTDWLSDLNASGERQAEALEELRRLLLRAARTTFHRFLGEAQSQPENKINSLAEDCAQEALVAVLAHLPDFRGDSRFTTWAYKFAVNLALRTARREGRGQTPLDLPDDGMIAAASLDERARSWGLDPELPSLQREIWAIIRQVILTELTPRQRQVLTLIVFEEVPMDVVVERLNTNRNAVYKMLHDARLKIKSRLLKQGIEVAEALYIFNFKG
jgi:RNA polymerase sigma-70 factor (ECF subfamily)